MWLISQNHVAWPFQQEIEVCEVRYFVMDTFKFLGFAVRKNGKNGYQAHNQNSPSICNRAIGLGSNVTD